MGEQAQDQNQRGEEETTSNKFSKAEGGHQEAKGGWYFVHAMTSICPVITKKLIN